MGSAGPTGRPHGTVAGGLYTKAADFGAPNTARRSPAAAFALDNVSEVAAAPKSETLCGPVLGQEGANAGDAVPASSWGGALGGSGTPGGSDGGGGRLGAATNGAEYLGAGGNTDVGAASSTELNVEEMAVRPFEWQSREGRLPEALDSGDGIDTESLSKLRPIGDMILVLEITDNSCGLSECRNSFGMSGLIGGSEGLPDAVLSDASER